MKEVYYKLEDGNLRECDSVEKIDGAWVSNPTAEQLAKICAFPRDEVSFVPPITDEGYHALADGFDVKNGKWVKLWKVKPIIYTYGDYNRALEDYLYSVRAERGYTDREPTEYIGSKVPRWDSDGRDYRSFRDDVMLYALPILNEYKETGKAPTLEEFKAGFPKMVWTYQEEEV